MRSARPPALVHETGDCEDDSSPAPETGRHSPLQRAINSISRWRTKRSTADVALRSDQGQERDLLTDRSKGNSSLPSLPTLARLKHRFRSNSPCGSGRATQSSTASDWRPRSRGHDVPSAGVVRPTGKLQHQISMGNLLRRARGPPEPKETAAELLSVAISSYEAACREMCILPKFARAAREGCNGEELSLSGQGCGDLQMKALLTDTSLVPRERLSRWRLRDTRLTGPGTSALCEALAPHTEILDLSRNEISLSGSQALSKCMLGSRLLHLRKLDLSANGLKSEATAELCVGLRNCPALLSLDLNHNLIEEGKALGQLLADHRHVMRLSLHCNFLTGRGVSALFGGLLTNSRSGGVLADLDVAWNGISDAAAATAAEAIAAVLRESVSLFHLDLSYNSLDPDGCAVIANGLRDNHHLYGLHMVGNAASIDADGFLQPVREDINRGKVLSPKARPTGTCFGSPLTGTEGRVGNPPLPKDNSDESINMGQSASAWRPMSDDDVLRERDGLEQRTSCWACEGWERVELVWPCIPEEPEPKAVWAFTSLDRYRSGLRLQRTFSHPPRFAAARMVPGGYQLHVIFQVDSALRVPKHADNVPLDKPVDIQLRACPQLPELNPPPDQEVVINRASSKGSGAKDQRLVIRTNKVCHVSACSRTRPPHADGLLGKRTVVLDGPGGAGAVHMLRITETEFRSKVKREKGKPFFANFKKESEKVRHDCLFTDWGRAKVGRIVGEKEQKSVQDLLKASYGKILAIYRFFSAVGVSGGSGFGVNQIEATDALTNAGIIDDTTRLSDVDRFFIASKVLPVDMKKTPFVVRNDKGLVRHQFLELLLRVADHRYVQTGQTSSITDAVSRVLDSMADMGTSKLVESEHFFAALHTEAVDDVYRRHADTLQAVYTKYSGRLTPPGLAKFMAVVEFQDLLQTIGAYDAQFQQRQSAVAFRMGMMTQPEESMSSRFQEMSFLEFQHAIGAVVFLRADYVPERMAVQLDQFFASKLPLALPTRTMKGNTGPK